MLLQITNTCHGNCIHCLQDSTPEPQHMSMETFDQFFKFCVNTPTTVVNISGGEPTEHPHFEEIVRRCAKHFKIVTIISNGFFVFNREKYILVKKLLYLNNVFLQVTTHKLYYPKYKEWNKQMYIANSFVPWVCTWLSTYEYWLVTGNWHYDEILIGQN